MKATGAARRPSRRVIVREVPNSANRLALIQTGAVDIAQWLLPNELAQLKQNPAVLLNGFRSNFQVIYSVNTKKQPFDNPKVREALKWAFPYDAVLKTVFMNTAEPCKSIVPSIFPDNNEILLHVHDRSRQSQDSCSPKPASRTASTPSLTYNTEISWDEQLAILTQTNLAKVGINATLTKLPGGQYFDQEWGRNLTTYFFEDQPNVPAAEYALWAFANSKSRGDHTSFMTPELDRLTDGALAELDPAKRKQHELRRPEDRRRARRLHLHRAPALQPGHESGLERGPLLPCRAHSLGRADQVLS